MAAGAPPAAFGGGRAFLDDPEQASQAKVVGDLAALNLQLIHFLGRLAPAGDQRFIDDIADRTRLLVAASDASQQREQNTARGPHLSRGGQFLCLKLAFLNEIWPA